MYFFVFLQTVRSSCWTRQYDWSWLRCWESPRYLQFTANGWGSFLLPNGSARLRRQDIPKFVWVTTTRMNIFVAYSTISYAQTRQVTIVWAALIRVPAVLVTCELLWSRLLNALFVVNTGKVQRRNKQVFRVCAGGYKNEDEQKTRLLIRSLKFIHSTSRGR
jgi:hypothetical protein